MHSSTTLSQLFVVAALFVVSIQAMNSHYFGLEVHVLSLNSSYGGKGFGMKWITTSPLENFPFVKSEFNRPPPGEVVNKEFTAVTYNIPGTSWTRSDRNGGMFVYMDRKDEMHGQIIQRQYLAGDTVLDKLVNFRFTPTGEEYQQLYGQQNLTDGRVIRWFAMKTDTHPELDISLRNQSLASTNPASLPEFRNVNSTYKRTDRHVITVDFGWVPTGNDMIVFSPLDAENFVNDDMKIFSGASSSLLQSSFAMIVLSIFSLVLCL